MSLNKEEYLALKKIVNKIKEHFTIKKIMLFGSKARNDSTVHSDVDILLLVNNQVDDRARWKLSDIVSEVEWDTGIYISCRLYNNKDWEEENEDVIFLPFKDNVTRDGELIEI